MKDDPEFHEFLSAHQSKSTKPTWSNDTGVIGKSDPNKMVDMEDDAEKADDSSEEEETEMKEESSNDDSDKEVEEKVLTVKNKSANKRGLSDIDVGVEIRILSS